MTLDLRTSDHAGTVWLVAGRTGVVWVDRKLLREARQRAGLTQPQLGALLGHGGGDLVGEWERGRTRPDVHSLRKLAEVLKVKPQALLAPRTAVTLGLLRILAGLTQAEAAEAIRRRLVAEVGPDVRMSRETWAATERGKRAPGRDELDAIAAVLGVTPAEVLRASGATPATTPEVVELTGDEADEMVRLLGGQPGESLSEVIERRRAGNVDQGVDQGPVDQDPPGSKPSEG